MFTQIHSLSYSLKFFSSSDSTIQFFKFLHQFFPSNIFVQSSWKMSGTNAISFQCMLGNTLIHNELTSIKATCGRNPAPEGVLFCLVH